MGRKRRKFVRMRLERQARSALRSSSPRARRIPDAYSVRYRRPYRQSPIRQVPAATLDSLDVAFDQIRPARISWPTVKGVASIRWVRPIFTTSLNSSCLRTERVVNVLELRSISDPVNLFGCGNIHRRRKGIVRRLRHIDVVVRMDWVSYFPGLRRRSRSRGLKSLRWHSCFVCVPLPVCQMRSGK